VEAAEPIEVDVAAIHHIDCARFWYELVQDIHVVQLAITDEDERRDIAAQIEQRVQLDRRLGRAERRPRKDRQAKIDCGRVERVDGIFKIERECFVRVEPPGNADQALREAPWTAALLPLRSLAQRESCRNATTTDSLL
jgi:hypothetical protein